MENLYRLAEGLNRRFPNGNDPYQIMTRLLEECGELASEVNHQERSGVKVIKHGEPNLQRIADELKNVLSVAAQAALYYGVCAEVEASIEASIARLRKEGCLP